MPGLAATFKGDNLDRAWRWIRTNPDATYKAFFRSAYSAYAVADTRIIADLRERLRRGSYEPFHAAKIYFPKRSGILRPYSLLTVEDQIAYQAMVNTVAEQLFPRVRHRYYVEAFGHLYAGRTSQWFYRKWSDGYALFNKAAREAFANGLVYTASFDLTAFYDSLDHGVLQYFLRKIGCDRDFADTLVRWLSIWTATDRRIYHHHGIPQGPLGSGLVAEVVLQYFDQHHRGSPRVRYLRYVDDIRMFAKTENELRSMIVHLDKLSKDVGLFPQSSKIDIHRVQSIAEELKTISTPSEAAVRSRVVDQSRVQKRLIQLSPRHAVADVTRFKYVLAYAAPSAKLNERLWRILESRPDLYASILRYFEKYLTLPARAGTRIIELIKGPQLYPAVTAALVYTACGRLRPGQATILDRVIKKQWGPVNMRADLVAALGRWAFERRLLTAGQVEYAIRATKDWYGRGQLVRLLEPALLTPAKLGLALNERLRDNAADVSVFAAAQCASYGIVPSRPLAGINRAGGHTLRELHLLGRLPAAPCQIHSNMVRLLGKSVATIDWRAIFGPDHDEIERIATWCRAYADTDATAFVNTVDVFNDWLLVKVHGHDPALGGYQLGNVGGILSSIKLKVRYPKFHALVSAIHSKRLESLLSHARVKSTGRPTGPIKFSYLRVARRLMVAGLTEVWAKW